MTGLLGNGIQKAKGSIVPSLLPMHATIITCQGGCASEADEQMIWRPECEPRCLHSPSVGPGRDWNISEQQQNTESHWLALWDDSCVSSMCRHCLGLCGLYSFSYLVSHSVMLCPQTHRKAGTTAGCGGLGVGCGAEG